MADEIHTNLRGPNGESLSVNLRERSISITSRDVIALVAVLGLLGAIYLAIQAITKRQDSTAALVLANQAEGFHKQAELLQVLQTNQSAMLAEIRDMREHTAGEVRANREQMGSLVREQNQLLAEQTHTFNGLLQAQTSETKHDLADIKQRITITNWNATHEPAQQIPVDMPTEQLPRRQEGPR